MVERPVHVAAGSSYDLMQQQLLEHPSSCSRPGHLAGSASCLIFLWAMGLVNPAGRYCSLFRLFLG